MALPFKNNNNNNRSRGGFKPRVKEEPYNVNERIRAANVRVVGENVTVGVYPLQEAIKIAQSLSLDLVEISPNADPPVCKVVDYSKFKYEQKKKQKEIKSNALKVVVKEIRFGPNTDDHDFEFKLKHAISFLKEGSKVRAIVYCDNIKPYFDKIRYAVDKLELIVDDEEWPLPKYRELLFMK